MATEELLTINERLYKTGVRELSPLKGSAAWNPGDLVDGAGETKAITVTGAKVGIDGPVHVIPPYDIGELILSAALSADNTVEVHVQNETGGNVNLADGVWTVIVLRYR